jgi:hypothetical protein
MNLVDPADAYRRLDARERAASDRYAYLSAWGEAVNKDLAYYAQRPGREYDDGYAMALAAWVHIDDAYAETDAEIEWIDAERRVLDQELAAAGLDWRDYDGAED